MDHKKKVLTLTGIIISFAAIPVFLMVGLINPSHMWAFFVVAFIVAVLLVIRLVLLKKGSEKLSKLGIITIILIGTAISGAGAVHIVKAANAYSNYEYLRLKMMNVSSSNTIDDLKFRIKRLPSNFRDTELIKHEMDDLDRYMFNIESGRTQFKYIYNFNNKHINWDCSKYLYNYSFEELFIDTKWNVDGTTSVFKYSKVNYNTKNLSYPTSLKTGTSSGKDYYFFVNKELSDDKTQLVNEYLDFGFVNKVDSSDWILSFKIDNFRISTEEGFIVDLYCYADGTHHTLTTKYSTKI